ncbi:MAG: glycosyl hydrolase, partial [Acidobacteriaceae bacterium]|nr:glycosyl hydrolase [Acidobacteriaceae bacterium]
MKVPQWNTAIPQGFLRSLPALFILVLLAGSLFGQDPKPRDAEPANPSAQQNSSEQQQPEDDDPLARQKYIEELRGAESGVPPGARAKALHQMDEMIRQEGESYRQSHSKYAEAGAAQRQLDPSIAGSSPTSSQWLFIGPQPTTTTSTSGNSSGRVTSAVVDPNDATGNTVYIGAAQGGVWKTTNGGTNWTALTDSQPSLAIGSLAIDSSTNPSTIYVGTGEPGLSFDSYYGAGVLKSSDGGATWTQLGTNLFGGPLSGCITSGNACGGAYIGGLSVRPAGGSPATLIAAVNLPFGQGGIYRTTDGGVTWSQVVSVASGFSVGYATNLIAYAGIDGNGIYKSIDGGASWAPANGTGANLLTTSGTGRVEFAVAKSDTTGNTVYAAVGVPSASGGTLSGFYRTVDGGVNWTKLGPGASPALADFCSPQCWYDLTVAVNPTNANIVFVGGSAVAAAVSKSTTGGASWVTATAGLHVDHHASAFTPDGTRLYWGSDGGIYKTTDTGTGSTVAWTNINATLGVTQFYSYFALHPSNINVTFGGAQDNGTQKYDGTQALSTAWSNVTCGDGGGAVIDFFSTTNVMASCQNIDIRKSTNSGTSFASSISGITTSDRVTFIAPLVGDNNPAALNNLYFGTFRVYQSKNSGSTWSAISGDLTGGSSTISNMAVAPGDINTMYAATRDGKIWKGTGLTTVNCASTLTCFTQVTGTGLIAARRINAVAISPTDPNTVYVGQSGFSSPSTQHISMTTTGGNTWTDISNNLPNAPVNDIVVDPDIANTIYAATDIGVFRSQDNGATWSTLANGLPRIAVYGLKLHKASRTLRAATHGRGFWDLSVPIGAPAPLITLST